MHETPSSPPPPPEEPLQQAPAKFQSMGAKIRELADELIFMFVLVMFIKMFLVEHYKIPSGSMTPTLLGGLVAFVDVDGDGAKDLVFWEEGLRNPPLVFLKRGDRYLVDTQIRPDLGQVRQWAEAGLVHTQNDHILVNRLAYWFHWPRRGEIVVFKVPEVIYRPEAPIYIKRLVGEPGNVLTFTPEGRLAANGKLVSEPDFFRTQDYLTTIEDVAPLDFRQPEITYSYVSPTARRLEMIRVPQGEAYVFGDNTYGSLDSRYWGGVPLNHFKGRAFLRIWPLSQMKFLH